MLCELTMALALENLIEHVTYTSRIPHSAEEEEEEGEKEFL